MAAFSAARRTDVVAQKLSCAPNTRAGAKLDDWLKEISPSNELRKWFHHEPERWDEFVSRYQAELQLPLQPEHLERLRKLSSGRTVTLLYAARNECQNHTVVLRDLLLGG